MSDELSESTSRRKKTSATRRGLVAGLLSAIVVSQHIRDSLPVNREEHTDRLTYTGVYELRFDERYDPRLIWEQRIDSPAVNTAYETEWLTDASTPRGFV